MLPLFLSVRPIKRLHLTHLQLWHSNIIDRLSLAKPRLILLKLSASCSHINYVSVLDPIITCPAVVSPCPLLDDNFLCDGSFIPVLLSSPESFLPFPHIFLHLYNTESLKLKQRPGFLSLRHPEKKNPDKKWCNLLPWNCQEDRFVRKAGCGSTNVLSTVLLMLIGPIRLDSWWAIILARS